MSTTETPRTNAVAFDPEEWDGRWEIKPDGYLVKADFARELERENAALRNLLSQATECEWPDGGNGRPKWSLFDADLFPSPDEAVTAALAAELARMEGVAP